MYPLVSQLTVVAKFRIVGAGMLEWRSKSSDGWGSMWLMHTSHNEPLSPKGAHHTPTEPGVPPYLEPCYFSNAATMLHTREQ